MKFLLPLYLLIFWASRLHAQSTFSLTGSTNLLRNGKAALTEIAPGGFYTIKVQVDTAALANGRFRFTGRIQHPQQYRLYIFNSVQKYISEPFFIDKGYQTITIDSAHEAYHFLDLGYGVRMTGSKAHAEYMQQLLPRFAGPNQQIDLLNKAIEASDTLDEARQKQLLKEADLLFKAYRRQRDSILLQYATQYPSSALLPWYLYGRIRKFGYNDYYQQTASLIAPYIPAAMAGYLKVYLSSLQKNTAGNTFPLLGYIQQQSPQSLRGNRYLLVEFWFSACAPCLAQFEQLRPLYKTYRVKGFDILAIATDAPTSVQRYQNLLKDKQYPWPQLLDLSAAQSATIGIHKYPSSFLLNQNGTIVATDIRPEVLEDFLKENL